MEETPQENKVLSIIPVNQYLKICYVLVLISAGYGIFSSLLGIVTVYIPGGGLFGLLGIIGLVLALLGFLLFEEKFSTLENSHFKYLAILFVAFFITAVIFANALAGSLFLSSTFVLLISLAQFGCLFVGYRVWQAGQEASKENLMNEFENLKAKIKKS